MSAATDYGENLALNTLVTGTRWIQLHTGNPGEAGTANVAAGTDRQSCTWTIATGSAGTKSNASVPKWVNVPNTATYSHFSIWTAATGGNGVMYGPITDGVVVAGDGFEFPVGSIVLTAA